MIENIEQAKERFKRLVDFYKLNDPNNYDYDDRDLISMKLVLEEIERLNNIIKDIEDYINFLVIYNQTISGKFSETQWGQDILGLIRSESNEC